MSAPSSSDTSALRLSSLEFQKAFPREYLLNFLQRDLRPDGRLLLENRPTSVFAGANA
jgi:exosome complex RNA-binding protein Rrp42 (RNase PH superfamily)